MRRLLVSSLRVLLPCVDGARDRRQEGHRHRRVEGLGARHRRRARREGVDLSICARIHREIQAAAERLRATGWSVHAQVADVTDPEAVRSFVSASVEAMGGLDILINNAGRAHPGNFEQLSDQDWQADLEVKLFPVIRCAREALPHLRARGRGRIVNINAVLGKQPDPAFFATSVNRAACLSLTKSLSIELTPENILINSVNIGSVITPQWENIHLKRAPDLPREEFFRRLGAEEIPLGLMGGRSDLILLLER